MTQSTPPNAPKPNPQQQQGAGGPGITLKTPTGAMLVINEEGILISNGQGATISLVGPTVTVNEGALTVT